jgi:hypothetical protein
MKFRLWSALVCASILLAGCGRVSPQRIEKAAARATERRAAGILTRDLARDNASRATRLKMERRVYRYTTESQAREAERKGFPPRTHFTASEGPGRPLSGTAAQDRYGLPYTPDRRLSVTLPPGTPVKANKVVGGAPGYGELRIERSLSPDRIRTESVLQPGQK